MKKAKTSQEFAHAIKRGAYKKLVADLRAIRKAKSR